MRNLKTKFDTVRRSDGFTIIEVMIVLAVAGMILLIVLLAVPALQRNSRNTAMKNDANATASAVSEYESNNSGALPKSLQAGTGGAGDYILCDASPCTTAKSEFRVQGSTTAHLEAAAATPTAGNYALGNVDIDTGMSCNATTGATVTASARASAIIYTIETGGGGTSIQCVSS